MHEFCWLVEGTSTDVSRFAGSYEHVFETTTAGVTIQAPQVRLLSQGDNSGSTGTTAKPG